MADERIEDISTGTISAIAAGDMFVALDVSDTTDDAQGTAKNVIASTLGLFEMDVDVSGSANSDINAVVGKMYVRDISGFTADKDFILPTTAAVGDRIGLMIETGDNQYELDIHTVSASGDTINGINSSVGTASWSRVFITGEMLIFRCTEANTAWVVEHDGRIPCVARVHRNGTDQTGITDGAATQINFTTAAYDNGSLSDATDSLDVRRTNKYLWGSTWRTTSTCSTGGIQAIYCFVAGTSQSQYTRNGGGGSVEGMTMTTTLTATNGDAITMQAIVDVTTGSATISGVATNTFMWVRELFNA